MIFKLYNLYYIDQINNLDKYAGLTNLEERSTYFYCVALTDFSLKSSDIFPLCHLNSAFMLRHQGQGPPVVTPTSRR
jgi:hypothetical protein